jgi:glycerate kinase
VIVGVGGSATTDGGIGAVEALGGTPFANHSVRVRVACDISTMFLDAARVFSPQKGADETTVRFLGGRLEDLASRYADQFGVDVTKVVGGGAAGGLAGGLAALGAELVPGFDLVADALRFDQALADADMVVTGEGKLDLTSFRGKVVGGVARRAATARVPVGVVVGTTGPLVHERAEWPSEPLPTVSLVERFGEDRAHAYTWRCVSDATVSLLALP